MNFCYLKVAVCPICSAAPQQEGVEVAWTDGGAKVRVHANGQRWEWRQFLCGYRVQWVPNFERVEAVYGHECRSAPESKAKQLKRESAAAKLKAFIDALDVDDAYKRDVRLPYL